MMLNYDFIILVWSFWEGWNRYSVGLCWVFGWTSQKGWILQGLSVGPLRRAGFCRVFGWTSQKGLILQGFSVGPPKGACG
jgi:hypothetical protein